MKEHINTNEALKFAEGKGISITLPTLISWCENYKIGKKIGGRWRIKSNLFLSLLEGKQWDLQEKIQ